MANFQKAFEKTMVIEGGYSNDPTDAGGETWHGISRRFHPNWPGWSIIDKEKESGIEGLDDRLTANSELKQAEQQFYRDTFWSRFDGDNIPLQSVAEEMFDTAVNMGVHRAVIFLQGALNLLNRNQKSYPDIIEDGVFGPTTLQQLLAYTKIESGGISSLLKVMNTLQGMHYVEYMRAHPEQEKYARGWLERT